MAIVFTCQRRRVRCHNIVFSSSSTNGSRNNKPPKRVQWWVWHCLIKNVDMAFDLKGIPMGQCWSIVIREQFNWTNEPFHNVHNVFLYFFRSHSLPFPRSARVCEFFSLAPHTLLLFWHLCGAHRCSIPTFLFFLSLLLLFQFCFHSSWAYRWAATCLFLIWTILFGIYAVVCACACALLRMYYYNKYIFFSSLLCK